MSSSIVVVAGHWTHLPLTSIDHESPIGTIYSRLEGNCEEVDTAEWTSVRTKSTVVIVAFICYFIVENNGAEVLKCAITSQHCMECSL